MVRYFVLCPYSKSPTCGFLGSSGLLSWRKSARIYLGHSLQYAARARVPEHRQEVQANLQPVAGVLVFDRCYQRINCPLVSDIAQSSRSKNPEAPVLSGVL